MARFNKAKNFAGKSYVVSNEVEELINSLTFDAENSTLGFGEGKFGDDTTAAKSVSFADWIGAAKTAATNAAVGNATDTEDFNTVYGAKAYARHIVDEVSAAAIGVAAGDGIKISSQEGSTTQTISTDIKLVSVAAANGATATYALQIKEAGKDTYKSVGTIDIPKDMVATKGELVDRKEGETEATGTYIKMTVANGNAFYINVADLIEYNSYDNSDTISFAQVEGEAHKYTFSVIDGSITTVKIADANVTAVKLSNDAKALFDAAGKAQELINALDSTQTAAEGKYISGITQVDGVITEITETALPAAATLVTGTDNGTVKFNGADVAVQGLKSAAFEEASAFDAAGAAVQALTDAKTYTDTAIQALDAEVDATGTAAQEGVFVVSGITQVDGVITDVDSVEVEQAGAAAAAKTELLGSDVDAAGAATIAGANKAAAAASTAAGVADGKAVAAQNTADGIKTAVSGKAVELIEKTVALSAGTTDGVTVAIADGVVTMTVPGRVICVYDAQGKQVYPDVTYAKATSTTTLVADYGATALDASWDVTYTKAIAIAQ